MTGKPSRVHRFRLALILGAFARCIPLACSLVAEWVRIPNDESNDIYFLWAISGAVK